jgi:hypothetical protein
VQQPTDNEGLTLNFGASLQQKGWDVLKRNTDSVIQDGLKNEPRFWSRNCLTAESSVKPIARS